MYSHLRALASFAFCLSSFAAPQVRAALDPCDTKLGQNKYVQSRCFDVRRPVGDGSGEEFRLRASLWAKDLTKAESQDTLILIPGGPGDDSESLRRVLNEKDILNAIWNGLPLNVVLFDPRGVAHSQFARSAEGYDPSVFFTEVRAADLEALIEVVSPRKPVILFAHSEGGNSAALFAHRNPTKVKGLIFHSASLSTREIAESNLILFSRDPQYFRDYFAKVVRDPKLRARLQKQFAEIEDVLISYENARLVGLLTPQGHRPFGRVSAFRSGLVIAVENDRDGTGAVSEFLGREHAKMMALPENLRAIPSEWRKAKVSLEDISYQNLKRSEWMRAAVVCKDGMFPSDLEKETIFNGLIMGDLCLGLSRSSEEIESLNWVSSIQAPTLWIGGTHDHKARLGLLKRNSSLMPRSRLILIDGAGHQSFQSHPVGFYLKGVEPFLRSLLETDGASLGRATGK